MHNFFRQIICMSDKMLQHERIDLSEGIDTNKTGASKEYMLCHYWYFKDIGYNKCHHVLMTAYEL